MDPNTLLLTLIVLLLSFALLSRYVAPNLPKPWGTIVLVTFVVGFVIFTLTTLGTFVCDCNRMTVRRPLSPEPHVPPLPDRGDYNVVPTDAHAPRYAFTDWWPDG